MIGLYGTILQHNMHNWLEQYYINSFDYIFIIRHLSL